MKNIRSILLWTVFTIAVVASIIFIMYKLNNKEIEDKEMFTGRREVEYTGNVMQTLNMTLDKFFEIVVGISEKSVYVTDENELVVKYDTVITYDGRLLQGIVEEKITNNKGEKVTVSQPIEFKVYSEYKTIPSLYKFGMKMYNSFEIGQLDSEIKVLFSIDEEKGVYIYKYNDSYYYSSMGEVSYNNEKYDTFKYSSEEPEGYEQVIQDKLKEIVGEYK